MSQNHKSTSQFDTPPADAEQAWLKEAEKRYRAYRKGKSKGIPADQVFANIRQELGWQRRKAKP